MSYAIQQALEQVREENKRRNRILRRRGDFVMVDGAWIRVDVISEIEVGGALQEGGSIEYEVHLIARGENQDIVGRVACGPDPKAAHETAETVVDILSKERRGHG